MDIVQKIEILRKSRNWSIYKLADEAGITQSTLSNMFSRGTQPSIATLTNICAAFGMTLAQFFAENEESVQLSIEEKEIIKEYRLLNLKQKKAIQALLFNLN